MRWQLQGVHRVGTHEAYLNDPGFEGAKKGEQHQYICLYMPATAEACRNGINVGRVCKGSSQVYLLLMEQHDFMRAPDQESQFLGQILVAGVCVQGSWLQVVSPVL